MRATIKDVAAAAGVSIKTVSRVLNNERYVGAATRHKVQATVTALGFRPNSAARSLAGRRSGLVALLYDPRAASEVVGVLAGMQAGCATEGARSLAVPCATGRPDEVSALLDAVSLDGVVLLPPLADEMAIRAALAERGVRTVLIAPGTIGATSSVGLDDARAAAVMTRHLLALGHRRIGFVGTGGAGSGPRAGGHRAALAAAGIGDDPALLAAAPNDFAGGARAGAALLELAEPPSAIFAASDTMAAGVLTAAHARGLRVPEDVSVAGFGDEALAAYVWPPLTTIRASAHAIGEAAVDLILSGLDERREIGFELVERASAIGTGI